MTKFLTAKEAKSLSEENKVVAGAVLRAIREAIDCGSTFCEVRVESSHPGKIYKIKDTLTALGYCVSARLTTHGGHEILIEWSN